MLLDQRHKSEITLKQISRKKIQCIISATQDMNNGTEKKVYFMIVKTDYYSNWWLLSRWGQPIDDEMSTDFIKYTQCTHMVNTTNIETQVKALKCNKLPALLGMYVTMSYNKGIVLQEIMESCLAHTPSWKEIHVQNLFPSSFILEHFFVRVRKWKCSTNIEQHPQTTVFEKKSLINHSNLLTLMGRLI